MASPVRTATWVALFGVVVLAAASMADARVRRYKWEVSYQFKSLDCVRKLVVAINGRIPGPTILAQEGDTIVVELRNRLLTENVAIHWHGIRQVGAFEGSS